MNKVEVIVDKVLENVINTITTFTNTLSKKDYISCATISGVSLILSVLGTSNDLLFLQSQEIQDELDKMYKQSYDLDPNIGTNETMNILLNMAAKSDIFCRKIGTTENQRMILSIFHTTYSMTEHTIRQSYPLNDQQIFQYYNMLMGGSIMSDSLQLLDLIFTDGDIFQMPFLDIQKLLSMPDLASPLRYSLAIILSNAIRLHPEIRLIIAGCGCVEPLHEILELGNGKFKVIRNALLLVADACVGQDPKEFPEGTLELLQQHYTKSRFITYIPFTIRGHLPTQLAWSSIGSASYYLGWLTPHAFGLMAYSQLHVLFNSPKSRMNSLAKRGLYEFIRTSFYGCLFYFSLKQSLTSPSSLSFKTVATYGAVVGALMAADFTVQSYQIGQFLNSPIYKQFLNGRTSKITEL